MIDVANVHHVHDAAHGDAFVGSEIEERRQDFVADEKIIAIAKDGMRPREPAVAVKLVVIETELADELRMLGTAALDPRPDIQND